MIALKSRLKATFRSLVRSRLCKLQTTGPGEVDPVASAAGDDPHQARLAARAAHDRARRVHVDVDPAERVDRAAAGARRLGGGHLHGEDLAQEPPDRVAVELPFVDAHLNLPSPRISRS